MTSKFQSTRGAVIAALVAFFTTIGVIASVQTLTGWHFSFSYGHSMLPAIRPGDFVAVRDVNERFHDPIEVGDIVVFKAYGKSQRIQHRVVAVNDLDADDTRTGQGVTYVTRGDNNDGVDGGVRTLGDIIGVVKAVIPRELVLGALGVIVLALSFWLGRAPRRGPAPREPS